jgi:5-methylcytosine-specific restriction endonuclease McrA
MSKLRDPNKDKWKSWSVRIEQARLKKVCCADGCNNPLTQREGPGSDLLCREDQLKLVEYGGAGRLDRLHTLHRKWICDDCGIDVSEQVRQKHPTLEDDNPMLFNRLCRNRIIGDHQVRRADGGTDAEENIRSLCLNCNSDKTILNEDWRKGTRI